MSFTCEYCGKKGLKNMKLHMAYCPEKPGLDLPPLTREEDPDEEFERQAVKAETIPTAYRFAGVLRDFMPTPCRSAGGNPCDSWFLRPDGALPEDAFVTARVWAKNQRDEMIDRGFLEITPSKGLTIKINDRPRGAVVVLDMPDEKRWERIMRILESRRVQVLDSEQARLADEETMMNDTMGVAERRAQRHRLRNCQARINALSKPFDSKKLLAFIEKEVRASRLSLQTEEQRLNAQIDERIRELVGDEEEED